jgi:hypothetical protein
MTNPTRQWKGWEQSVTHTKGFHVEMKVGPKPDPDPQGSVVHVASIRGNTRSGQPTNPSWIEFGYRYKPVGWPEQGCNCWAIFYGTDTVTGYPKAYDLGPAAPGSTHTFEFASNDQNGYQVWIDGILRTTLPLPPDAWTDWAAVAQTEVYHHMETVDADFVNEVFYHSPFRQWPESLIDPFLKDCWNAYGMPYRPGPRFTGGGRYHYHDGPQQHVCTE